MICAELIKATSEESELHRTMNTTQPTAQVQQHVSELRRLIRGLTNRQLETLRRGLIDLLADVSDEKTLREQGGQVE